MLALCFGLFTAEALLADVHDGDATHEELVRADGADHAALHLSHGDTPDEADSGAHAGTTDDHPGEGAPGQSDHGQHACHCVHAHGLFAALGPVPALPAFHVATPVPFAGQTLASGHRDAQFRPPIA